jgi:hypothetical protein
VYEAQEVVNKGSEEDQLANVLLQGAARRAEQSVRTPRTKKLGAPKSIGR